VDAILDLLIPGMTTGIKERIVDLYGKPEILFFGPDEGTADFMDWASQHARKRGAYFWKAFTTGKSQAIGGIPHDIFGMTTRSVHQYVLGIYRKLGLKEENVTKLQTGGPDGDLGSNEIKISKDITIAIVDGSGVLYDPSGIDRTELLRLADNRLMIIHFDQRKLKKGGFRILCDENNITLPDGTRVDSGVVFRNEFHLHPLVACDVFVPCGGRPEAVDLGNVERLLNADGSPRFKYIVEGANLFFTQVGGGGGGGGGVAWCLWCGMAVAGLHDVHASRGTRTHPPWDHAYVGHVAQEARLVLEKAGAIIFKDASANKGGVTSSSLEVLAALSFTDEEFAKHMMVQGNVTPDFYAAYVKSVQAIIEKNAEVEFEAVWRESELLKLPKAVISDRLSFAIIKLNSELVKTDLWDNVGLRRVVLTQAFPAILLETLGLDTLLSRIPETYVKAIFGSYLASRFGRGGCVLLSFLAASWDVH
jgi:glutamate dehydrogenase